MNTEWVKKLGLKASLVSTTVANKQKKVTITVAQAAIGLNNTNTVVIGDIANEATGGNKLESEGTE